jgi:hypothetical protein
MMLWVCGCRYLGYRWAIGTISCAGRVIRGQDQQTVCQSTVRSDEAGPTSDGEASPTPKVTASSACWVPSFRELFQDFKTRAKEKPEGGTCRFQSKGFR